MVLIVLLLPVKATDLVLVVGQGTGTGTGPSPPPSPQEPGSKGSSPRDGCSRAKVLPRAGGESYRGKAAESERQQLGHSDTSN